MGNVIPSGENVIGAIPVDLDFQFTLDPDLISDSSSEDDWEDETYLRDGKKRYSLPPPEYLDGEREKIHQHLMSFIDESISVKVASVHNVYIEALGNMNRKIFDLVLECSKKTRKIGHLNREIMQLRETIAASSLPGKR